MQPKVSLVTACYNKSGYVSSMLESVLNQTWDNIEVIIVNDGSTDSSLAEIERYIPRLRRRGFEVRLINQENTGVSRALYNGLVNITGDYFCLPDADDLLKPEFVSALVGILENNQNYDVASCRYYGGVTNWDIENEPGLKNNIINFNDASHTLLFEKCLLGIFQTSVCPCLFRYSLLNTSDCLHFLEEGFRVSQEPQIWLPLLDMNVSIYYHNEILYIYRTEANGLSNNIRKSYADRIEGLRQGKLLRDYIIKKLRPLDAEHYLQLNDICYLFRYYDIALNDKIIDDSQKYSDMLTARVNERYFHCKGCNNIYAVYRAFSNKITNQHNAHIAPLISIPPTFKRIIGYGVLGTVGKALLPLVIETPLKPTELWDMAVKGNEKLYGISVILPELDGLSSDDALLVFIKDVKLTEPLYEKLRDTKATVLYYYDILDYMSKYHFPHL